MEMKPKYKKADLTKIAGMVREGKAVLVCVPSASVASDFGDGLNERVIPCPLCGNGMWIGPRVQAISQLSGVAPICGYCTVKANGGPLPEDKIQHLGGK